MKTIFKYDIQDTIKPMIEIFSEAQILDIQMQGDNFKLWALVDTEKLLIKRQFLIIGTGIPFDPVYVDAINHGKLIHLKTIQVCSLVYHFFENTMPF